MEMQWPKDETGGLAVAGAGRGELGQAARRALAEAKSAAAAAVQGSNLRPAGKSMAATAPSQRATAIGK